MTPKSRYVMVGGFLGAGKTTALLRLAEMYQAQGLRVGLITNDQSTGLVDTAMAKSQQFPVEEITGGCFCCRFDSLTAAADKLSAVTRPDVFLAEPVGSCTDLVATVSYPLRRIYGDDILMAPYSVLVDPTRAERMLGLRDGPTFSPKVAYIYGKQLEEAEILVVNKLDSLEPGRADALMDTLAAKYPAASRFAVSARDGTGFAEWAATLLRDDLGTAPAMTVDYDEYAEGEALLGWVNATVTLDSAKPIDGNALLRGAITDLHTRLQREGIEVAHLKMTLTPDAGSDLAVVNLVRTGGRPEFSHLLQEPLTSGEWVVNLRAEADPELLTAALRDTLAAIPAATLGHVEAFRPGRPVPTHRMSEA